MDFHELCGLGGQFFQNVLTQSEAVIGKEVNFAGQSITHPTDDLPHAMGHLFLNFWGGGVADDENVEAVPLNLFKTSEATSEGPFGIEICRVIVNHLLLFIIYLSRNFMK